MRTWSFSSMSTFCNCPRQYALTYVTPVIPYQETEATKWGTEVHLALEEYGRDGKPLDGKFAAFKPYADKIITLPGEKFFERQFALTRNLTPCGFDDPDAWCRGVIDLGTVDTNRAFVADYKTGKVRADSDQLKLFAAFIMQHYPDVQSVKTAYLWLAHKKTTVETYTRADLPAIWQHFMVKAARIEKAYESDKWVPRPSGLCRGWCGATKKHCEFWSPRT